MKQDYLPRHYEEVLAWYRSAETKAQLLLTLDGTFVTIAAAATFAKPEEVIARRGAVNGWAWVLLALSVAAIIYSLVCAVACLYSRLSTARIERIMRDWNIDPDNSTTYHPALAGWFGFIAVLPRQPIVEYLRQLSADAEKDMLSHQVRLLSVNVLKKHRWVNRGWVLAAAALVFLAASGVVQVITL